MNCWILLLLLFCGNSGCGGCCNMDSCIQPRERINRKEDCNCSRACCDEHMWTPYTNTGNDCGCEKEKCTCNSCI